MTRYPQLPTSLLVAMLSLPFMLVAAVGRAKAGSQSLVGVRPLVGLAKTLSAATRSVEGAGTARGGVDVDGSRYVPCDPV